MIERNCKIIRRLALVWLLGILLVGMLVGAGPEAASAEPAGQGAGLGLEVEGRLEPRRYVELGLSEAGRVESVLVEEGERVEAGAALLRLDGHERLAAEVSAAELELVQARQALEELQSTAGVDLGKATVELRQAEKDLAYAEDRVESLERLPDPGRVEQVYANLLLAENRLADVREDLEQAQKKYKNKNSIVWLFISQHDFRRNLTLLEKGVAYAERRYWDAKEKYEELIAPVDEIDLGIARGELASAQARVSRAERERLKRLEGPDPAEVEAAQARIRAAEAGLAAAKTGLRMAEISAPLTGVVVELEARPGEWAGPGQRLAVVADLSEWVVETRELAEQDAPAVQAGQPVSLSLDAYPELALSGEVESVSLYAEQDEEDVYYRAKIGLDEADPSFLWGLTARIRFLDP